MKGSIRARIEPRKKTDRHGYLCMPLKENVPYPKNKSWKLTTCKGCGRECWDKPYPKDMYFDGKLCTECAIRKKFGIGGQK